MDLHVIGPLASPAERAAVDAVLGPAESAWHGGDRNPIVEGHVARGGHEARSRRDLLIPTLHAVQSRIGWISQPALNYVSRRLTVPPAEAYGVATFYALFSTTARPPTVAHVCDDIACQLAGAEDVAADLERSFGPAGTPSADGQATWLRSPCLGLCERAPAAMFTIAGPEPRTHVAAPVDAVGCRLPPCPNAVGRCQQRHRRRAGQVRRARDPARHRPASPASGSWPASASPTPPRSMPTAPTAASGRSSERARSAQSR